MFDGPSTGHGNACSQATKQGSARPAASACRQQRNPQKCEFQHAWVGTSERHRHLRIVPAAPPVSVPEDGPSPIPRLGPFLCALIRGSRSGTDGPWLGLNPVRCLWSHGVAFQQGKQAAIGSDRAPEGIRDELELLAENRAKSSERKVRHPFFKGLREDL